MTISFQTSGDGKKVEWSCLLKVYYCTNSKKYSFLQIRKLPEFCPLCIFHLILFYFDGFCFYDPILYFISKFSRDVNFLIVKLIEMHNAVCAPKLLNNNSFHSLLHWIYIGHLLFLMIQ